MWLILAGAVAVLIICELGARAISPYLPTPDGWYSREVQAQVARMDERETNAETCLTFVGSSTVGAAIDPKVLTETLGRDDWYVAWVAGANARVLSPWTEEIVVPKLTPEFVVIGVTSFELNDAYGAESVLDSYESSPGRREAIGSADLKDRVLRKASEVSAFIALRPYFRSPAELVARLTGKIPSMAPRHGQFDGARDTHYGEEPDGMARVRSYVDTYAIGDGTISALERTIDDLQAQGRTVALVALPVLEDEWAAWHEHGEADIEAYREALDAIGERQGVPVFAYPGELQDEALYRDPIHLNGEGSALFSRALGADLRSWMDKADARCGE